jgi:hypothetical protein
VSISVIVVSYAVREKLRRCLASLASQAPGPLPEVIVVDNASPDGSAALVRTEFPWVRLVEHPENRGFAAAVNAGAGLAEGDAFLLLNPDTELPPGAVEAMGRSLHAHPRAFAIGFRQEDESGMLQLSFWFEPGLLTELLRHAAQARFDRGDRRIAGWIDRRIAVPRRIAWVSGAALLTPRAAFERVGGFDEGFFLFFEDIDYCLRVRAAGGEVWYDPTVTVLHHRGQSQAAARTLAERAYRESQTRFWRLHRRRTTGALFALYHRIRRLSP